MRKKILLILLLIPMIGMSQIAPRIITLNGVPVNLSFDAAYTIPMSGAAFTLTTSGTSGAATYSGGILNIPIYSGGSSIDSFLWCTRLWRQKAIDSLLGVITGGYYPLSNPSAYIDLTDISSSITGITYNNTTGVLSLTAGYVIPTTTEQTNWNTAYTNRITSLTTTGTSGAATLSSNILNIPQYQAAGSYLTTISGIAAGGSLTGTYPNPTIAANVITTTNISASGTPSASSFYCGNGSWAVPGGTPGGSSGALQYNNAGLFDGATGAGIGNDGLMYFVTGIYTVAATAPSSGNVKLYGSSINGQDELWVSNSSGVDIALETFLGQHQWGMFTTNGTAIQTTGYFASAITSSGTSSFNLRTYDATNLAPNLMYNKLTGTAAANNQVELYFGFTSRDAMIGNAAYGAGSKLVIDCVLPAYVSTQRFFAGYAATFGQIGTTADPSAQLNTIGVGKDVADATLFFMFNNGSGTATKVNTGITPTANDEYIITVTIPSNATSATVAIERRTKTTSTKNSATNSAKIPAAGTLMYWHAMSNSGATSTAPVIGIKYVWEELYN